MKNGFWNLLFSLGAPYKSGSSKSMFRSLLIVLMLLCSCQIRATDELSQTVTAEERLNLVMDLCKKIPGFNNETPVPELTSMLTRDLNYVRKELKSTQSKQVRGDEAIQNVERELTAVELWIGQEQHKHNLTLLTYAAIGDFLGRILSPGVKQFPDAHEKTFLQFMEGDDEFSYSNNYKYFKEHGAVRNCKPVYNGQPFEFSYLHAKVIVIPHVSQTGETPVKEIVRAMGFFGTGVALFAAAFLDIPTNPIYICHYNNCLPMDAYGHSLGHISSAGFMSNDFTIQDVIKMAFLTRELVEQHDTSVMYTLVYELFHETNLTIPIVFRNIVDYMENGYDSKKENIQASILTYQAKEILRKDFIDLVKKVMAL
jgi:hypothetical protein